MKITKMLAFHQKAMRVFAKYVQQENLAQATEAARQLLITWLTWNDPNGCYTDEDHMVEFGVIATYQDLLENYEDQNEDDDQTAAINYGH